MKLKHKKEGKLQKGITLIALVITIIVLLILAGVSIATLTGDNGILTKAQTAKEETQKASEEEQRQLAMLNASMNTEIDYYTTEDENGKTTTVPIPAGFAPTGIEGENSIEDGVVITDENGNEFVWIPCDIADNNGTGEITNDGKINYNATRDENWKSYQFFYNGGTWGDGQPNKDETQNSIKTNKGFYVARYEAGIPENAPFYANKDGDTYYTATPLEGDKNKIIKNIYKDEYKPISKKGVPVWNFIDQKNAQDIAENMIKNNKVQSYLIDSHAWDTICRVIQKYDNTKSLTNSTGWGNYYDNTTTKYENLNTLYAVHTRNNGWDYADTYSKGQITGVSKGENRLELSTGASDNFKAYNIYDFAGNVWEWTTENGTRANVDGESDKTIIEKTDIDNSINAVFRGGSFHGNSNEDPVVDSSGGDSKTFNSVNLGFRVVLYML